VMAEVRRPARTPCCAARRGHTNLVLTDDARSMRALKYATQSLDGWHYLRHVRRRVSALHWSHFYRQSTVINSGVCFWTPARDAEAATRYI
jgi:hypothetical protein